MTTVAVAAKTLATLRVGKTMLTNKRFEMKVLGKLGRESSGADSEEEESGRKEVDVKQGGEEPLGREAGAHFVQEQKGENLLGLAEWRKKMLRRMG